MKKMLIINTKYRVLGGEDTNIIDEIEILKKNYNIHYLEYDNSTRLNLIDLVSFFTGTNFKSNQILKNTIKEFQPDIVYFHNLWFKGNLGILKILNKLNGVTMIHKIHNFRYLCTISMFTNCQFTINNYCSYCGKSKKKYTLFNKYFEDSYLKSFFIIRFGKKYRKLIIKSKFDVLVLNQFHKQKLIEFGVSQERIHIYYNPLPIDESNHYDEKSETVVFAGRFNKNKGIEELLEAWSSSNFKNYKLILIGDGNLRLKLQKIYDSKSIIFVGEKSNSDTKNYIKKSRAVLTCSKTHEGQPRILSEASSFGIPSIYPSFGGLNEYFPENYELAFEQYNYIDLVHKLSLITDDNFMKNISHKVYKHTIEILGSEEMLNKFESLIG